jgi:hypothetical protein
VHGVAQFQTFDNTMKYPAILVVLPLFYFVSLFTGCSRHESNSISDVETSLRSQFQKQWEEKKDTGDTRSIKEVHVGKFYSPNGNNCFYVELNVIWNNTSLYTSSPIVPLGGKSVAVSFQVPDTNQYLAAIISTQK